MSSFIYHPEITFEDTNLVGNIYFANFVRWQSECRNEWLSHTAPDEYVQLFKGVLRLVATQERVRFRDSVGASLGDTVEVELIANPLGKRSFEASFEIRRLPAQGGSAAAATLANGMQQFSITDTFNDTLLPQDSDAGPTPGTAYVMEFPLPLDACRTGRRLATLDLFRWQGKCRERFLSEYAPDTLRSLINRNLILHTTQVELHLWRDIQLKPTDLVRLEMRLTHFKGGRLTMQFDYFIRNGAYNTRIASGSQSLCCKHVTDHGMAPTVFPVDMLCGLLKFAGTEQLRSNIQESMQFADCCEGKGTIAIQRCDGLLTS